jgi:hypothetical protein
MKSTLIYCNNVSVVYLSTNLIQHQCTKHVKIDLHFVREHMPSVMSVSYTCRRHPSSRTSSQRVYLLLCSQNFDLVSIFVVARVSSAGGVLKNVLYYRYVGLGPSPA